MFKKLYHRLFSTNTLKQLIVWALLLAVVFVLFLFIKRISIFGIANLDWEDLFHSMTSYDGADRKPVYVVLYLVGVAFFSGLLVMILTNAVRNKIDRINRGDVRYRFRDHLVFLGYNEVVLGLLSSGKHDEDIVILVERGVSSIREELMGVLGKRVDVYVLHGSRVSQKDLIDICIQNAKEIYLVGEGEENADFINLQSLKLISSLKNSSQNSFFFLTNNGSENYCSMDYYNKFLSKQFLENNFLVSFDFDDLSIKNVFADSDANWPNLKLHQRNGIPVLWDSEKYVHLVVFGMNEMTKKIITAAANYCHFPNHFGKEVNTIVTIIDEKIGDASFLINDCGHYFDFCKYEIKRFKDGNLITEKSHQQKEGCGFVDIDFEFIEANYYDRSLLETLKCWSCDGNQYLSIFVCLGNDFNNSFNLSISFPQEVFVSNTPIWLYAKNTRKVSMLLDKYPNIIAWGSCWEPNAIGKWDRRIAAELCKSLEIPGDEIPANMFYQDLLDFASYLSILHTSTTSSISGKNCSADETKAIIVTEYTRNCVKSLFNGEDSILNILIKKNDVGEKWFRTAICNFEDLDEIKYYYEELVHLGLKIFQGKI